MKSHRVLCLGVLAISILGGCRFKGGESFSSATTPQDAFRSETSDWKGDPYASGGIAEASGGLKPQTSYQGSARANTSGTIDPTYSRPAYGSGQKRGEQSSQAMPGHDTSNAPVFQPGPITNQ